MTAERRALLVETYLDGRDDISINTRRSLIAAARQDVVEAREDPCPHCVMEHVWPCPTIPRCDEPGCEKETSCGWPSDTGYRRTCGGHYRAAREYAKEAP